MLNEVYNFYLDNEISTGMIYDPVEKLVDQKDKKGKLELE